MSGSISDFVSTATFIGILRLRPFDDVDKVKAE